MKTKFPAKDGWIRMEFTMTDSTPRSENWIKRMVAFGDPVDSYEFGRVEQFGKKIKVVARRRMEAAA